MRASCNSLPDWAVIFEDEHPPKYWTIIGQIVNSLPRSISCVEIGSGLGDILALLLNFGFSNIVGIEREIELSVLTNKKLDALFTRHDCVIAAEYPIKLHDRPNLLIQANCIYADGISTKDDFKDRLQAWHKFNGVPDIYLLEVVDSSYCIDHPEFPSFLRLSENDIRDTFPDYFITGFRTYQYPENKSTKQLYEITVSGQYKINVIGDSEKKIIK